MYSTFLLNEVVNKQLIICQICQMEGLKTHSRSIRHRRQYNTVTWACCRATFTFLSILSHQGVAEIMVGDILYENCYHYLISLLKLHTEIFF
jgi:hypothetical protein